jgi:8-oxo-dGTP pyrophosphatase MutT (NUDIX family)
VRKKGSNFFILPGGKPEEAEADLCALVREIREELDCGISNSCYRSTFHDVAVDAVDTSIEVRLFSGNLIGEPKPTAEIEELVWIDLSKPCTVNLASSLANSILPYVVQMYGRKRVS